MTVLDDTYTRANSTTSIGSTEANAGTTGTQAYTTTGGPFGVISNRGYRTGSAAHHQAHLDLGAADHEIYADLYGNNGEQLGLLARFVDTNNHYMLNINLGITPKLYVKLSGTFFEIGTPTGGNCLSGERWGLRANGSTLKVYRGGTEVLSVTDTNLASGTKVGINAYDATTTATWDNLHANTLAVNNTATITDPVGIADSRSITNADITPPAVTSLTVNGSTLTITYNEPLETSFVPLASSYVVVVDGSADAVNAVSVANTGPGSAGVVTLALASPVSYGQVVTLTYNQ